MFTKRPATVVLLSCCRLHRFLDLLFSAVVLRVVLLFYIINMLFQQEVLNKGYNTSLKPHLHDIHFGCDTPKDGQADRYFGDGPPEFLPCRCQKSGGPEPPPEVVLACLKGGPCAEKIFCGVGSPITDAALLAFASRTPWIRVHTNEEDTPNIKFAIVPYPYKDTR